MELTIKIDVTPFAGDDPEVAGQLEKVLGVVEQDKIQRQLDNLINDYSDGRYNFNSEVIEHHFVQLVLSAIQKQIQAENFEKYGREMVPRADGNGSTSRAVIETGKQMRDIGKKIHIQLQRK